MLPPSSTPRTDWRRSRPFLRVFVFVTGAAVMAVEFAAQRLLAPFFGSSQLVWGTLIGLILLALSGGYAIGGRLADRYPTPRPLGLIALLSGVFIGALPAFALPLLNLTVAGLLATPANVVLLSFVAVSVLFIPPVAALGAVSPCAVRLSVDRTSVIGRRTGSLYAWSTAGSIAGTFLSTFVTIPVLGVRATLWIFSAVLILLGASLLRRLPSVAFLAVPLFGALTSPHLLKPVPRLIAERETPYQFAQLYRMADHDVALSVNDAAGIQSVYTPRRLTGMYYDAFLTLPFRFSTTRSLDALLVGMGAGTIPTLYRRDVAPFRKVRMTGVELDPALTDLGRRYFHLQSRAARVVHADGRVYLRSTRGKFDLVMVDAFSNEIYIPFSLTTREFFHLCARHLKRDGIVALNVGAISPRSELLNAFERTLGSVFSHVAVARISGSYNYFVAASNSPLPAPRRRAMPAFLQPVAAHLASTWQTLHLGPGLILTDDHAPVEELTDQMILERLKQSVGDS